MIAIRFHDSDATLDRSFLNAFSLKIAIQVVRIILMHRAEVKFRVLEDCMLKIFHRLYWLILYIQRAMTNAGCTLAPVLRESMREIVRCTLVFLRCSISEGRSHGPSNDWRRIHHMAKEVLNAIKSFKENLHTNAAVIQKALEPVVNDKMCALREIKEKEGLCTSKSNRDDALTSNPGREEEDPGEEYRPGAQRIAVLARALAVRFGNAAVKFIEEAMFQLLEETYAPGLTTDMEELLKMSTKMKDSINRINLCFSQLTLLEIHVALHALGSIKASISQFWQCLRQPETSYDRLGSCLGKSLIYEAISSF